MCGIAGVMTAAGEPPVDFGELRQMIAMLSHRGPDGYGLYRDQRIGLAHSRLSIIDLVGGAQPLCNHNGKLWLTFNGEIFNFIELRQQLSSLGHRFTTNGDSEVIVHCYEQFGPRAWKMLNGQFAFALWDSRLRKLWLVRDRLGILPLHYTRTAEYVLFASEAKALFAGGRTGPNIYDLVSHGTAQRVRGDSSGSPGDVVMLRRQASLDRTALLGTGVEELATSTE